MENTVYLKTPLTSEDLEKLQIGDKVYISGTIYTGRDAAHKRLVELVEAGKELPFDIKGQVIYYVGPAPAPPGKPIGSAGPTTSYRMDPYAPILMDAGLKGMIGKGPRNQAVIDSMQKNKAVYFAAIGGAAVVVAESIKEAKVIAYEDLGTEAIREMKVENFPCIVANDVKGNDIYKEGVKQYQK
ncbi:MAG: Fe-S-containing hydro-lyase [Candidatus Cloacimonetes bacterium]|nr:Fe-S-containing hydro-lyase [Candidatus Cloacimonadota bacterium]MCF7813434.1 Fe-S-containing hydro-lyase [Candidatus Cloacimonadota bacterium]MCF7867727.1 Fe-S-containing hydro-lyase [Candidatus Cloacimonadota bacterium]MCF7883187.1 Fe-S-containing hydro-lyase [Candidatus Cloacimonadota bacterium]